MDNVTNNESTGVPISTRGAFIGINLRPNKPESFAGSRDFLTVNTWLYKMTQYFSLMELANSSSISDHTKITFASTMLSGSAAIWWYTTAQTQGVPTTWTMFEEAVRKEFIPTDHERRARDKLRSCRQSKCVSEYITRFRNVTLLVPGISEGEKWDRFVSGLKPQLAFEIRKENCMEFEESCRIALRIESALLGCKFSYDKMPDVEGQYQNSAPAPMEIGNFEGHRGNRRQFTDKQRADLKNNACFKCHKVGCRPWKHNKGNSSTNVLSIEPEVPISVDECDLSDESEEN